MFYGNMNIRESHAFFLNMPVFLSSCYSTCFKLTCKNEYLLVGCFFPIVVIQMSWCRQTPCHVEFSLAERCL